MDMVIKLLRSNGGAHLLQMAWLQGNVTPYKTSKQTITSWKRALLNLDNIMSLIYTCISLFCQFLTNMNSKFDPVPNVLASY